LIVDDDPVMRALLQRIIDGSEDFEVAATAVDAFDGRDKIVNLKPDLMTLDIEMPKVDGITFLRKVTAHHPVPTIIVSSLATGGSTAAEKAIEAGALDAMPKPVVDQPRDLDLFRTDFLARLRGIRDRAIPQPPVRATTPDRPLVDAQIPSRTIENAIVAIGASTGGTEAIRTLLESIRPPFPPIVVVQHMPAIFTKVFAVNLAKYLPFEVIEGKEGDTLKPGRVIIAPGDYHMEIKGGNGHYSITVNQRPALHGVRPAVDYLFSSLARVSGKNCVAAVLTGMGRDGADGATALRSAGGWVVVQDEKTSVVFGMPKAVIDAGAADDVKPIGSIGEALRKRLFKLKI
jgi:two-component system chemotaxis response regulator CheB